MLFISPPEEAFYVVEHEDGIAPFTVENPTGPFADQNEAIRFMELEGLQYYEDPMIVRGDEVRKVGDYSRSYAIDVVWIYIEEDEQIGEVVQVTSAIPGSWQPHDEFYADWLIEVEVFSDHYNDVLTLLALFTDGYIELRGLDE